jgi:hypothetical protein
MIRQFTFTELQGRNLADLHVLYRQMQLALSAPGNGSDCLRHAHANLDLIRRVILLKQRPQGPRF